MCTPTDAEGRRHLELVLYVARRVYIDGVDQGTIAAEISYSRATVSRLLAEARRRHIVRFEVGHPLERVLRAEKELTRRFGLTAARVAEAVPGVGVYQAIGQCGADVLREVAEPTSVIAVSNGHSVSAVVDHLPRLRRPETCVVQMIGTLANKSPLQDSSEITRRLAEAFGGTYRLMPSPLIVAGASLARALRKEESIATVLALGAHADVALVGIGAAGLSGSGDIFSGLLTPQEAQDLDRMGAVGHLLGHHFTRDGRHVVHPVCERVMAVPLERTGAIRAVIAVAGGTGKVKAVRGALAGRYIDILVTDSTLADALLGGS